MADIMDSDFDGDGDFNSAAEHVQKTHDKYHPEDLLTLYGLYKQATIGNCNTEKPGVFEMKARAKWNSWHSHKDMSQKEARDLYLTKVKDLDPKFSSDDTQKGKTKNMNSWAVHSIEAFPEEMEKKENEKSIFDFVKDGNLDQVKFHAPLENLNQLDENGIGLLHWAADRNQFEVLKILLEYGADVNMQDFDQQTALHYASSLGNTECVKVLLHFNADKSIEDSDGQTCLDVAENEIVASLLKQ